jgi:hypothetical protein
MKIIKLKGGLGNQLFQYAFGRLLAITNKTEIKYYTSSVSKGDTARQYKLDKFNTEVSFASEAEAVSEKNKAGLFYRVIKVFKRKILKQYHIGYDINSLSIKENFLEGYWQSYKYLEPIRDILLKEISLKTLPTDEYVNVLNKINNCNSVSLHIRRGDYVNDAKTKREHYVFGLEYYKQAIEIIKSSVSEPNFYIFSDDIEWAKENLDVGGCQSIFVSNFSFEDYEELMLMSKCKHNIIANSSFSFWGAWLNQHSNKIVIAPSKWNNRYDNQYRDLLPPEWIKIKI